MHNTPATMSRSTYGIRGTSRCGHHATRRRAPAAHGQLQLPSSAGGREVPSTRGGVHPALDRRNRIRRPRCPAEGAEHSHQFPALPGMIRRAHTSAALPEARPFGSPFRPVTLFLGTGVSSMVGGNDCCGGVKLDVKRSTDRIQAGTPRNFRSDPGGRPTAGVPDS